MEVEGVSPAYEPLVPWQPLSARRGGAPIDQTWQEGIPKWIHQAVCSWLDYQLHSTHELVFARLHYTASYQFGTSIAGQLDESGLLDWIDTVLKVLSEGGNPVTIKVDAKPLAKLLHDGHSVWKVSDALDGLERRQDTTVTLAAHQAGASARSIGRPAAAEHLEAAWRATYGLHPNPSEALGQAILAVEAVAVPAVVPSKPDATLGHVYGQLSGQGHLYELAMLDKSGKPSSVAPVTQLVGLLWHGHKDRHEGNIPAIPATQAVAEMAVHAAAALVKWFSTDAVRRKSAATRKK